MKKEKIDSAVLELISEQFVIEKDKIDEDLGPGDLPNWDSIGHVHLIQKLENFFKISLSVYDVMAFNSVKDIKDSIFKYITEKL